MMSQKTRTGLIESLLFIAGDEGLTIDALQTYTGYDIEEVETALNEMKERYEKDQQSGLLLKQFGHHYQIVTKLQYAEEIKKMLTNPTKRMLTQASLEVLAIIAYEQPVTKVEVDTIRGVGSEGPVQTLVSRGLIEEKGRLDRPGNPILYGTTELFLDRFGLASIDELPEMEVSQSLEQIEEENEAFMKQFQATFQEEEK